MAFKVAGEVLTVIFDDREHFRQRLAGDRADHGWTARRRAPRWPLPVGSPVPGTLGPPYTETRMAACPWRADRHATAASGHLSWLQSRLRLVRNRGSQRDAGGSRGDPCRHHCVSFAE